MKWMGNPVQMVLGVRRPKGEPRILVSAWFQLGMFRASVRALCHGFDVIYFIAAKKPLAA